VIDCATRKVAGWAMDDNYRTPLITSAIEMAARSLGLPADAVFIRTAAATILPPSSRRPWNGSGSASPWGGPGYATTMRWPNHLTPH
jgi:transposase InsO family protein